MAEWTIAFALKAKGPERVPRVQIPYLPPMIDIVPGCLLVHDGPRQWLRYVLDEEMELLPEKTLRPFVVQNDTMLIIAMCGSNAYVLTNRQQLGWIHVAGNRKLMEA